jgi:hypothetical protein
MRGCSRERRLTGFVANSRYRPKSGHSPVALNSPVGVAWLDFHSSGLETATAEAIRSLRDRLEAFRQGLREIGNVEAVIEERYALCKPRRGAAASQARCAGNYWFCGNSGRVARDCNASSRVRRWRSGRGRLGRKSCASGREPDVASLPESRSRMAGLRRESRKGKIRAASDVRATGISRHQPAGGLRVRLTRGRREST